MAGSHDLRVTSPGASSCCGSCCEVHQAALQGPRGSSSCCSHRPRHHHHHHDTHQYHHHHHHHRAHHRRQRGSRLAATSASSCSSSSPPSSPPHSLRRYPLPPPPAHIVTSVAPGQHGTASPFELRRLPVGHFDDNDSGNIYVAHFGRTCNGCQTFRVITFS